MTREEAIKILEFEKQGMFKSLETKEALDIAIKALSAPEREYINKEDTLDKIVEILPQRAYLKCLKAIDNLPTFSIPEREKGTPEEKDPFDYIDYIEREEAREYLKSLEDIAECEGGKE